MENLVIFILIVGYAGFAWKFWTGFTRTNFTQSLPYRITLSLLWPVFFIANKSYRRNFRKALKG
jgi:cell shape-determining protein MreD